MFSSLQYRLSVDIGHLVVEAMHEGLSATEAVEVLRDCLALAARNAHFGMETPPARYHSLHRDAARYDFLRCRDLDAIKRGGVFAGQTPDNVVLSGIDLDAAVDIEIAKSKAEGA